MKAMMYLSTLALIIVLVPAVVISSRSEAFPKRGSESDLETLGMSRTNSFETALCLTNIVFCMSVM